MIKKLCLLLMVSSSLLYSQQNELHFYSVETSYFYGSILEHNLDISHLITDFPTGVIVSLNKKTYGYNEWEGRFNFPDWGVTMIYQDMKNPFLGKNISIYGHFNFYFLKRHLSLGVGQGIAYASKIYDPETNFNNNAYGSRILSSTLVRVNLVKENLFKGLGVRVGTGIIHYSNANLKAPNGSTNTWYFDAGISYQLKYDRFPPRIPKETFPGKFYQEDIKLNLVFRTGVNEADVNGLGQDPFYVFSFYADKRLNFMSTVQFGFDLFYSTFLKKVIEYRSIAFPEDFLTGDEDYKRIGLFIGHELRFNKNSFVSQVGYYIYWPYKFETRIYNRLGIKRYLFKDKFFAAITLKAHFAKAEAVEFGAGVRF